MKKLIRHMIMGPLDRSQVSRCHNHDFDRRKNDAGVCIVGMAGMAGPSSKR